MGERGRRRGLDVGEWWAAYWCEEREGERLRREGEVGCAVAPWSGRAVEAFCEERLLDAVLWDHRFMLAAPSRKAPMPSAAPLAALERRLAAAGAAGGGVARDDEGTSE